MIPILIYAHTQYIFYTHSFWIAEGIVNILIEESGSRPNASVWFSRPDHRQFQRLCWQISGKSALLTTLGALLMSCGLGRELQPSTPTPGPPFSWRVSVSSSNRPIHIYLEASVFGGPQTGPFRGFPAEISLWIGGKLGETSKRIFLLQPRTFPHLTFHFLFLPNSALGL